MARPLSDEATPPTENNPRLKCALRIDYKALDPDAATVWIDTWLDDLYRGSVCVGYSSKEFAEETFYNWEKEDSELGA